MKVSVICQECNRPIVVDGNSGEDVLCPKCGARLKGLDAIDVFISHAKAELETAKRVRASLGEKGIACWLAADTINVGERYRDGIEDALRRAKVVALILSPAAVQSRWVKKEIELADSFGKKIFPFMVEDFDLPPNWPILLAGIQFEKAFRQSFEAHVNNLASSIHTELRKLAFGPPEVPVVVRRPAEPRSLQGVNPDASPYLGPKAFTPDMTHRFFGRTDETERLLERIALSRVVLVYAPSGAGKSSLLNTKIRETLEETGHRVLLGGRVGGPPPEKTLTDEIRNIYTFSAVSGLNSGIALGPGVRLTDFLRLDGRNGPKGRVLVFDQFEELFTQHVEYHEHRAGFFDDLVDALNEDRKLRLVFSMREEYLAKYEEFETKFPSDFNAGRFHLKRIKDTGALEAITQPAAPYAEFAKGVARYIVDQLNTRRVLRPDGAEIRVRAEFIEMMHLQIVCDRLWKGLQPGITRIEMEDVERAGGEGRTFDEFVVNALDTFYHNAVEQISKSEEARAQGFSEELIRLGCMKFITPSLGRTMVKRTGDSVGRLPDWIVAQLEDSHLLRHEQRGDEQWYELAHDRLAEPVGRRMDHKVNTMLYATDLLDKMLEQAKRGGSLEGYFVPRSDILKECEPFHGEKFLLEEETEFIFRISLSAGQQMQEWSRRIRKDYKEVWLKVLREALRPGRSDEEGDKLRQNAAALVGEEKIAVLSPELLRLVLSDPSLAVKRTAALSLAQLDDEKAYAELTSKLREPEERSAAQGALSLIRVAADRDSERKAAEFDHHFVRLARGERWKIQWLAWRLRFADGRSVNLFIALLAAAFSIAPALGFKLLLGSMGYVLGKTFAISAAMPSFGASAFHGLTAGFIWAGSITLGVSLHHLVFLRRHAPKSYLRPFGAIVWGSVGGLLGSALIVIVVVLVFTPESLERMGWVVKTYPQRDWLNPMFWKNIFGTTRYGYIFLITGIGLGIGMALMTNGIRKSQDWIALVQKQNAKLSGFKQTKEIVFKITRIALRYAWLLPLTLTLAASIAFLVPKKWTSFEQCYNAPGGHGRECAVTQKMYDDYHRGNFNLALDIAGDCTSQAVGGFFGMVGFGLGIIIVRSGYEFQARKRW